MTVVIGALVIVAAAGYAVAKVRRWILAQWWLVALGRFLTGEAHHGKPITDAGWLRHGQKALTPTGHATRWWHRPRWQRAAHRTGGTLAAAGLVLAFLANPQVTGWAIVCLSLSLCIFAGWLTARRLRARRDRRTWLHPLHLAMHERVGIPRATRASDWLEIETDVDGAVRLVRIYPPQGWPADAKEQAWLVATAGAKAGIEGPEVRPALAGPRPSITLIRSEPAPAYVAFADVLDAMAACRDNEILIGLGKKGEPVVVSLGTDSPHIAISMGTGAGKSNLAGFILLQVLLKEGIGLVLDAKRGLSYPWILKDSEKRIARLPNVLYAKTTAQLHDGMTWLSEELDRRNDVAFAGMDTRGRVHASVGPRLFTIAEELNVATPRLRSHWQEIRDPGSDPTRSPAFTGMDEIGSAGRQVRMHVTLIGQMLTAAATGRQDSALKENCGIKMLARYGPKGWRTMCEDVPMPPPPDHLGRVQVVTGRKVREAQVPELDPVAARQMVLDSAMALLPSTVPRSLVTAFPPALADPFSPALETVSAGGPVTPAGPVLVTLREAVEQGHVSPATTLGSLRMARWRERRLPPEARLFPDPVDRDGTAERYDAAEIAAFDAGRR